jgi:hypothetical protein
VAALGEGKEVARVAGGAAVLLITEKRRTRGWKEVGDVESRASTLPDVVCFVDVERWWRWLSCTVSGQREKWASKVGRTVRKRRGD